MRLKNIADLPAKLKTSVIQMGGCVPRGRRRHFSCRHGVLKVIVHLRSVTPPEVGAQIARLSRLIVAQGARKGLLAGMGENVLRQIGLVSRHVMAPRANVRRRLRVQSGRARGGRSAGVGGGGRGGAFHGIIIPRLATENTLEGPGSLEEG